MAKTELVANLLFATLELFKGWDGATGFLAAQNKDVISLNISDMILASRKSLNFSE